MVSLFDIMRISNLSLKNRFVRSATWEGMAAEDGSCTRKLTDMMVQLVEGGVGLIISGHAYVSREGQAGPGQLGIYDDALIPALAGMMAAVHQAGGKMALQLAHAGCNAAEALTGLPPLGPSVWEGEKGPRGREATLGDISRLVHAFGQAAERAKKAGFDAVQIHSAHGYLLSQFLSPFYNKRQDAYGGSIENRARMVLEVYDSIRKAVGPDFPVFIKMNARDFVEGGMNAEEMVRVASLLEQAGMDAVELSGGTAHSGAKLSPVRVGKLESPDKEVYYRQEARLFKDKIRIPLMLVGGIRSYEVAAKLVEEGLTDFISLSRPLIREPNLVNRWKSGDTRKSTCLSDNQCFKPAMTGKGLYCVVEAKEKAKTTEGR